MSLGYVRIDEVFYPVVGFELLPAAIKVTAIGEGPLPAASGPVRVFTARGEAVTENGCEPAHLDMAEIPVGSTGMVRVFLHFSKPRSHD